MPTTQSKTFKINSLLTQNQKEAQDLYFKKMISALSSHKKKHRPLVDIHYQRSRCYLNLANKVGKTNNGP